jgi:hypothetical protein
MAGRSVDDTSDASPEAARTLKTASIAQRDLNACAALFSRSRCAHVS